METGETQNTNFCDKYGINMNLIFTNLPYLFGVNILLRLGEIYVRALIQHLPFSVKVKLTPNKRKNLKNYVSGIYSDM